MARFGLAEKQHQVMARFELRQTRKDLQETRRLLASGNCAGALGVYSYAAIGYGRGMGHKSSTRRGDNQLVNRALHKLRHKIVACFTKK